MCTVAFVPTRTGDYLLGHNRDERNTRARALPPKLRERDGLAFLAPTDPDGGGTWIGVNAAGVTLCLLNATESPGRRLPTTPRSRGLVLEEMLHLRSMAAVTEWMRENQASLLEARAFHLVVAEPGGEGEAAKAARFRWNGKLAHWDHDLGPQLFVSSSLRQAGAKRERGASWVRFRERVAAVDRASLATWLTGHEPERGKLSVCMHRSEGGTMSRTLVETTSSFVEMAYLEGPPCEPPGEEIVLRLARRSG
jgi:hypothetical protein